MLTRFLRSYLALSWVCLFIPMTNAEIRTLEFEDLFVSAQYRTPTGGGPDSFSTVPASLPASEAITVNITDFTWSSGIVFAGGVARALNTGFAGGSGQDLQVNNVNPEFALAGVDGIAFDYGEYGGNVNLNVNGDFRNVNDFADVDGPTVGGVLVSIANSGPLGTVSLEGEISTLAVGGQELYIDNLTTKCAVPTVTQLHSPQPSVPLRWPPVKTATTWVEDHRAAVAVAH